MTAATIPMEISFGDSSVLEIRSDRSISIPPVSIDPGRRYRKLGPVILFAR